MHTSSCSFRARAVYCGIRIDHQLMTSLDSTISALYRERFGSAPSAIEPLRADGSNRRIWRLRGADGTSAIAFHGPDALENRAFLSFTRSFRSVGLPVPEIYAEDLAEGVYLEEDLGDRTLLKAIEEARGANAAFPTSMVATCRRVLEMLVRFQVEGGRVVNFDDAYPVAEFDRRGIMWDLNYFKYDYLKLAGIPFHETELELDFERLTEFLLRADRRYFLYRDFQPRNIMLRGEDPWFIDYQGGRRGALQYDVASLLYSSKAAIPDDVRAELLEYYLDALEAQMPVDRDAFKEQYRGYVVVRILQLLGAYGFRGYFERKPHFLESVPFAVRNIEAILASGPLPVELPELRAVLARIVEGSALAPAASVATPDTAGMPDAPRSSLTVSIRSFSYKRGYPEETSAHGGGFVFDCRSLHNPGRYGEYKELCGLDSPVITFLEREEAVESFFAAVWTIVSGAVRTYIERGFEHLSVGFGCTGGQHRSVYFAERLGRTLRSEFPEITVEVSHRESQRWPRSSTPASADSQASST
jgi:aminoglycoside/choline kinase family phosphotransferase